MTETTEARFHRIRFYEGKWSNFDQIEPCKRPSPCIGCQFKHPFCTENGKVEANAHP